MKMGKRYKSLYFPALTIVATVITLLVIIAVSTYRNLSRERGRLEDSLLREGVVIMRAIEAAVRAAYPSTHPEPSYLQRIMEEVSREPGVFRILIFDTGGNILASSWAGIEKEKVRDAGALSLLIKEKGFVTRYREVSERERTFEIIKSFYPLSYKDPLALGWGTKSRVEPQEEVLSGWAKDKMISLSLRLGIFEKARQEDIHHAILMGAILVILGTGTLYFIFVVQNYYLVDRTLAEMRTYTENVVKSMADGLISLDNDGKVVTLNRRAGEILGAPEGELKGKEVGEVLGQNIRALLGSENRRPIIHDKELEVPDRSGRLIPLSLSVAPLLDEMNQEIGSVVLIRDLREIRDLQEKVRRSAHLASLGRLAAGVAHEIRNPLSSIRGFAQYFIHRLKGQEEEQGYASIMVKEVDRLNRVITELLDFARPKEPYKELYALEEILEHSLKLLEPELAKKNVQIEKAYEPTLPLVLVDRDQLSQAFLNILLNSLESMDGGGRIRVGVKRRSGSPSVEVAISDTGRGIPPEDLPKIFEPFFSTKRKGTGLGLSIVHQIVERHGGDIAVESKERGGTAFFITLPLSG